MTAVDRSGRIHSAYFASTNPGRVCVFGGWYGWYVARGDDDSLGASPYPTHTEAIAAADRIARGESA